MSSIPAPKKIEKVVGSMRLECADRQAVEPESGGPSVAVAFATGSQVLLYYTTPCTLDE